ncbi:MAG: carbon-nitrogen hydrolase family protein [Chloroflexota bacterium]
MELHVAGLKLAVGADIIENTRKLCLAVERAAEAQVDILLTPEGSLSGYTHDFDQTQAEKGLHVVTDLAKEKGVGLALGTCFYEADSKCYNQLRFYQPDGTYLGFHSKTLTCGSWDNPPQGEINHYAISPLRTFQWGDQLTIGGLICNDLWANPSCTPMPDPHLSQQLAHRGVKVIFHAVNGGRTGGAWSEVNWEFHESNLRMRARAGGVWIVTVDNSSPVHIPSSAPSGVINPNGNWVSKTDALGEAWFDYTLSAV